MSCLTFVRRKTNCEKRAKRQSWISVSINLPIWQEVRQYWNRYAECRLRVLQLQAVRLYSIMILLLYRLLFMRWWLSY